VLGLGADAQAAPKTIKISSVLSLTGKMSGMGTQIKPSYEIFADQVNAKGGIYVKKYGKKIPVELRVLDDESDGLKTQTQLEVANSWGAVANLGGLGCGSFEMGTPICQKNKMVWVGPGCGGWMPHQLGNEWLYSIFFKTPFFSPLVFDMIQTQPKPWPNKVAVTR
jgi:branched-chain amino acid transport system substrate-binding protein